MFFDFRYHMYKLSFAHTHTRMHACRIALSFTVLYSQQSFNTHNCPFCRTYNRSHDVLHKLLTKTVFFGSGFDEEIAEYKFNIKCMPVAKLLNIYTNALVFVSQ